MEEIWKDIYFIENGIEYDYRGKYQVSNLGNVRSLNYHKKGNIQVLKPRKDSGGYLQVCLCKNGKNKNCRVHRLVGYMFLENDSPTIKTLINHKDENKKNNNVNNLEWCTPKYNAQYSNSGKELSQEHKQKISKAKKGKKLSETTKKRMSESQKVRVLCIETEQIFNSMEEASEWVGISYTNISKCCRGEHKTCGGYHWKYVDTEEE